MTHFTKDLATIGLAIGVPLMLLTGIWIGVTVIKGSPAVAVVLFMMAAGLTSVSALAYLAVDASQRSKIDNR